MAIHRKRYIDIGANLLDGMFDGVYHDKRYHAPDLAAVLERAWSAGVEKIIITAGSLSEARAALALARTDARLFCSAGVHPTRCDELEAHPQGEAGYLRELEEVLRDGVSDGKLVALGECGLDYDRLQFCSHTQQLRGFRMQLSLARNVRLPLFLHMRAAADDFLAVLKEHRAVLDGGAVVHSYTGDLDDALSLLAVHPRLHIGINGCSLRTDASLDVMAALPLERLLAETDAPWCDMRPTHASAAHVTSRPEAVDRKRHRSDCLVKGRNEPCNMAQVVEVIAARRGLSNQLAVAETIARVTERLFFPAAAPSR